VILGVQIRPSGNTLVKRRTLINDAGRRQLAPGDPVGHGRRPTPHELR
jgi:hypothetical protein